MREREKEEQKNNQDKTKNPKNKTPPKRKHSVSYTQTDKNIYGYRIRIYPYISEHYSSQSPRMRILHTACQLLAFRHKYGKRIQVQ